MDVLGSPAALWLLAGLGAAVLLRAALRWRGLEAPGLEAVVLGLATALALHDASEAVRAAARQALDPAVAFALGALGLGLGFRMDIPRLEARPARSLRIATIVTLTTGALVGGAMVLTLRLLGQDAAAWPALAVLVPAALLAAPAGIARARARLRAEGPTTELLFHVATFCEIGGVVAFGLAGCWAHVGETFIQGRAVVAVEWLFASVIAGAVAGGLLAWFIGRGDPAEDVLPVSLIAVVLLASGAAYSLNVSPLFVGLVAGATAANASPQVAALRAAVESARSPLLLMVLFFAAAAWHPPADWMVAALLLAVFVPARWVSRWLGGFAAALACPGDRSVRRVGGALVSQGGLAVCVALNGWQAWSTPLTDAVLTCLLTAAVANAAVGHRLVQGTLIDAGDARLEAPA